MSIVIRCPACKGASRVGVEAIGELVLCPNCRSPFVAVGDTDVRAGLAKPIAPPQVSTESRPVVVLPAATPTLPPSVLFGLSLLPFIIPLVWLATPIVLGGEPILSMAVPISLALTGATLSLAVVSTVDWTPGTRIKGVLMIVGLAYFSGVTLYFLKKDSIEWAKRNFGDSPGWNDFRPRKGVCEVRVPGEMNRVDEQPLASWNLECHRSEAVEPGVSPTYTLAFNLPKERLAEADDAWFAKVKKEIEQKAGVEETQERVFDYKRHPGREWTMLLPDGETTRIVRVIRVDNRLYYLAVEGLNLSADSEEVTNYFESFSLRRDGL